MNGESSRIWSGLVLGLKGSLPTAQFGLFLELRPPEILVPRSESTVLRFIAWFVGAVIAVVAIVALVGWSLPVKHRATRAVTVPAKPEEVFQLITDVERFPSWRPSVKRVERHASESGRDRFREETSDGTITYVVDESVQSRRLVTRIDDKSLPFGGRWIYELTPTGNGTRLQITEEGEVYNPIFRALSRYVFGHSATIERYLEDVGRKYGAEVTFSSE